MSKQNLKLANFNFFLLKKKNNPQHLRLCNKHKVLEQKKTFFLYNEINELLRKFSFIATKQKDVMSSRQVNYRLYINVREYRRSRGNQNGQSRETGNIGHTRRRQTKQKHNTICVGHHYAQTNTNTNTNKI